MDKALALVTSLTIIAVVFFLCMLVASCLRQGSELRAECIQRGGTLIEASSGFHCVAGKGGA